MNLYVTGTDTEIGKTLVAAALLHALRGAGCSAHGFKPVASGATATDNPDVEALRVAASPGLGPALINRYRFTAPIAPHIAAAEAGVEIDIAALREDIGHSRAEVRVIEGFGGWLAPLGPRSMQAELARACECRVVLVVGMRLGCLNHALLSADRIRRDGLELAGWVANRVDPSMRRFEANLQTLCERLQAPRLGSVPHLEPATPAAAAGYLDVRSLLATGGLRAGAGAPGRRDSAFPADG